MDWQDDGQGVVYPRVCGGSLCRPTKSGWNRGLSPRVRGKLIGGQEGSIGVGSIPACAGEARVGGNSHRQPPVYPRVCGGSLMRRSSITRKPGLSPRVRGKPNGLSGPNPAIRSIPACAGEARPCTGGSSSAWVYPRVCGGSFYAVRVNLGRAGLSPRVRGKLPPAPPGQSAPGSIPACAGEAKAGPLNETSPMVYPRVCGGSLGVLQCANPALGLSPRVRGKPTPAPSASRWTRSIPACAGEALPFAIPG